MLLASLALFAHGIAFVALSIAVGRLGTPLKLAPRVASRAQPEHLQFVAPATPAPTLRNSAIGGTRPQRRLTADIPRGTLMQPPPTDTGASVTAVPLATSLPVDPRLLVVPGAANNIAVTRLRQVNAAIASRVRVLEDSVARARRRWTVGVDTAHRFGIANCGIVVDVICIPFGVGSMPNPATSGTGIDLKHAADEAEVRAAIARIRPTGSKSTDGTPEPTGP